MATNQDNDMNRNPEGKGGFGDHPEHRSDGRWGKDNSFSYWYNYFKHLSTKEFLAWEKDNPEDKRSVASDLAYVRVHNSRKDLKEFQEVADRSEGKPKQSLDLTSGGKDLFDQAELTIKVVNGDNPNTEPKATDSKGTAE